MHFGLLVYTSAFLQGRTTLPGVLLLSSDFLPMSSSSASVRVYPHQRSTALISRGTQEAGRSADRKRGKEVRSSTSFERGHMMKYSFERLSACWFATMTPAPALASTIQERETLRKRRLLSVIVLLTTLWIIFCIPLAIAENAGSAQFGLTLGASGANILALWLNRRGYL